MTSYQTGAENGMATGKAELKRLVAFTKQEGLCGDVDAETNMICTRKARHQLPHKAVLMTVRSDADVVLGEWGDRVR